MKKSVLVGIVAQCYDGANVMSGEHGDLQKLLNDSCGKMIILYSLLLSQTSFGCERRHAR